MAEIETWLTREQAAQFLNTLGCPFTVGYLAKMAAERNAGDGPPFTRSGWRTVRYAKSDLEAWAKRKLERVR